MVADFDDMGNMGSMRLLQREITKLKRLLDTGKITIQEFESRKSTLEKKFRIS